ncbi:MAG: ribonuclease R [Deltaproteobacteria bacterium]|nr:MAG: ribonuclease R [Deltaproteobacteria bacterium]
MEKTVAGTIRIRGRSAFFIRDAKEALPLKISYHHQLQYHFMDGDRLTASVHADRRGRLRVVPVRIISRALSTIAAVVAKEGRELVCIPFDLPALDQLRIEESQAENLRDGDAVIARINRYPSYGQPGTVIIEQRLGRFREPGVDDRLIIHRYQLPKRFPWGCRKLARELAVPVSRQELRKRTDLRRKRFITIDGDKARDFDDAVAIDQLENGGFRLYISIADVSHYVKPGSLLDREACRRGTSIYFPNRCIPMLPEELSNDICSLRPEKDRLTLTVVMEFDHAGHRLTEHFCPSVINCKARWTYADAAGILEGTIDAGSLPENHRRTIGELRTMEKLCRQLQKQRRRRGSIDFDLPEAHISFDLQGNIEDIQPEPRTIAHQMIEEFMLSANETVATYLGWLGIPFLYRVHPPPEPKKITRLLETLKCFGLSVKGWRAAHPKAFQELLRQAAGLPAAAVVNRMLLQIMQKAVYSPANCGHFGLALQYYTHFTSPIRRYPDLLVHRVLKSCLWPEKHGEDTLPQEKLELAGDELSNRERLAVEAERAAVTVKKLFYLEKHAGETFTGFVSGIIDAGLFITLEGILADGLLPFRNLDDYYVVQDDGIRAVGEQSGNSYAIGDTLQVCLAAVDPVRCRLDLSLPTAERQHRGRRKTPAVRKTNRAAYRQRKVK